MEPDSNVATADLEAPPELTEALKACFQCRRCSAGCPVAAYTDHPPHRVVQWAREGEWDKAMGASMAWVCASCQTCSARCPNGVPIAELMDALKQMALKGEKEVAESDVLAAYQVFIKDLKSRGRLHELSMISRYKLKTGHFFQDVKLGMALFLKGKLKLIPERAELPEKVRAEKKA